MVRFRLIQNTRAISSLWLFDPRLAYQVLRSFGQLPLLTQKEFCIVEMFAALLCPESLKKQVQVRMNILLPVKQSIKKLSSDLGVQLLLLYLLLVIPVVTARLRQNLDRVFEMFRLKKRAGQKAGTLSGGEQQMLAVARGIMAEPIVLLFDELSLGLLVLTFLNS